MSQLRSLIEFMDSIKPDHFHQVLDMYDTIVAALRADAPHVDVYLLREAVLSIQISPQFYNHLSDDEESFQLFIRHLNKIVKVALDRYSPDSVLFKMTLMKLFTSHQLQ